MERFVCLVFGGSCYLVAAFVPVIATLIGTKLPAVYSQANIGEPSPLALSAVLSFILLCVIGGFSVAAAFPQTGDKK